MAILTTPRISKPRVVSITIMVMLTMHLNQIKGWSLSPEQVVSIAILGGQLGPEYTF
jgi:hypothetical protein